MQTAIFIFYFILATTFIIYLPFFKASGLKRWQLISLFSIKVLAGIAYAFFYKLPKYYTGSDTWRFYKLSLSETQWLLKDPLAFIKDLFSYGYNKAGGLFAGENSYWNDLKSNVIIKLLAICNVFTDSNYYANIIIFNILFFFGFVALFRLFYHQFPDRKWPIILGIFLLPSTLFWCSGIHKDGLIISGIGLTIYFFYTQLKTYGFSFGRLMIVAICLLLIFSLRNYITIVLMPLLACWWVSSKMYSKKWLPFVVFFIAGMLLFFSLKYIIPSLDFPQYLAQKQFEFSQLEGSSTVIRQPLQPSLIGIVKFLPSALDMAFLRPHITETKNFSYIPAALENLLLLLTLVLAIIFRDRNRPISSAFIFSITFSICILLIAGYTITLSGAIVRYRSISLPLLITPMLCIIDFRAIQKIFNHKQRLH